MILINVEANSNSKSNDTRDPSETVSKRQKPSNCRNGPSNNRISTILCGFKRFCVENDLCNPPLEKVKEARNSSSVCNKTSLFEQKGTNSVYDTISFTKSYICSIEYGTT